MTARVLALILVAMVTAGSVAACASVSGPAEGARATAVPTDLAVLSTDALQGLAEKDRSLPIVELAKESSLPDAESQLVADGYVGGRERTFQGPSRHLTYVASRSLAFRDDAGARTFLSFVRAHPDPWFGSSTQASDVVSANRHGFVFQPSACACHLANPVFVGVVQDGPRLVWLEVNGPDATRQVLLDLLKPSRSSAA